MVMAPYWSDFSGELVDLVPPNFGTGPDHWKACCVHQYTPAQMVQLALPSTTSIRLLRVHFTTGVSFGGVTQARRILATVFVSHCYTNKQILKKPGFG